MRLYTFHVIEGRVDWDVFCALYPPVLDISDIYSRRLLHSTGHGLVGNLLGGGIFFCVVDAVLAIVKSQYSTGSNTDGPFHGRLHRMMAGFSALDDVNVARMHIDLPPVLRENSRIVQLLEAKFDKGGDLKAYLERFLAIKRWYPCGAGGACRSIVEFVGSDWSKIGPGTEQVTAAQWRDAIFSLIGRGMVRVVGDVAGIRKLLALFELSQELSAMEQNMVVKGAEIRSRKGTLLLPCLFFCFVQRIAKPAQLPTLPAHYRGRRHGRL